MLLIGDVLLQITAPNALASLTAGAMVAEDLLNLVVIDQGVAWFEALQEAIAAIAESDAGAIVKGLVCFDAGLLVAEELNDKKLSVFDQYALGSAFSLVCPGALAVLGGD